MDLMQRFNLNDNIIDAPDPFIHKNGYPHPHSGPCLVVGTAPCVHSDLMRALDAFPDADICAVNDATALVEANHLATCHGAKLAQFLAARKGKSIPTCHISAYERGPVHIPAYAWECRTGAGSALFAAVVMADIGYSPVILVGCPFDFGGGYAVKAVDDVPLNERMGNGKRFERAWMRGLQNVSETLPDHAAVIRSMSGRTKDHFGGIETWQRT